MSTPTTVRDTEDTITEFFNRFGAGDRPGMLALFAEDADFVVAGSPSVTWTGVRTTPGQIDEFLRIALEDITTRKFNVTRVITSGADGVVLGELEHEIHATGKPFAGRFALHITVADGKISRYHMFEDSHAAAVAFQP
jgi:ketosteroid isomerase-like protein